MLIFSKRTINFCCCWREIAGETEKHKDLKTPSHASRDRQKRSDNSAKEESSFFCFSFFKLQNVYWARSVRFFLWVGLFSNAVHFVMCLFLDQILIRIGVAPKMPFFLSGHPAGHRDKGRKHAIWTHFYVSFLNVSDPTELILDTFENGWNQSGNTPDDHSSQFGVRFRHSFRRSISNLFVSEVIALILNIFLEIRQKGRRAKIGKNCGNLGVFLFSILQSGRGRWASAPPLRGWNEIETR